MGDRPPKKSPDVAARLTALVEAETGGDPMTERKWVRSSLRRLGGLMRGRGVALSRGTVGRLLKRLGYSLRANEKRLTGPPHPDRDRQFGHIELTKRRFLKAGLPVISVDAKKKELVGDFKNAGRAWRRTADSVNAHDFRQDASHRAAPYGIYDLTHNRGYVAVGTSADTAEFAVDAIASWWEEHGSKAFPGAGKILILADAGGQQRLPDPALEAAAPGAPGRSAGAVRDGVPLPERGVEVEPGRAPALRPDQRELGGASR